MPLGKHASLDDFVQRHPLFVGFREKQKLVPDRGAPCLLIDNPELFRQLWHEVGFRPARNMPPDYLQGPIARAIDAAAAAWRAKLVELEPLPADREAAAAAEQQAAAAV